LLTDRFRNSIIARSLEARLLSSSLSDGKISKAKLFNAGNGISVRCACDARATREEKMSGTRERNNVDYQIVSEQGWLAVAADCETTRVRRRDTRDGFHAIETTRSIA